MKTTFATISLTLLLFSFSANAQDTSAAGTPCLDSEDCAGGDCSDGVCAAAGVDPNPAQADQTPKTDTTAAAAAPRSI